LPLTGVRQCTPTAVARGIRGRGSDHHACTRGKGAEPTVTLSSLARRNCRRLRAGPRTTARSAWLLHKLPTSGNVGPLSAITRTLTMESNAPCPRRVVTPIMKTHKKGMTEATRRFSRSLSGCRVGRMCRTKLSLSFQGPGDRAKLGRPEALKYTCRKNSGLQLLLRARLFSQHSFTPQKPR